MMRTAARIGLGAAALLTLAPLAPAQVKEPARTEKVRIEIRYRIRADRDERVRQFLDLQKYLTKLGFDDARKKDPDYDLDVQDPNAERMTGTIPSASVLRVLDQVRVLNILFAPDTYQLPEAEKPVAVKLGLRTGFVPAAQQLLHKQTVAHLARIGFVESLAYDTQGYTLVRGAVPARSVELLVKDVRNEPSGWFLPAVPASEQPAPFRERNPVRWAEVLPVSEFPAPFVPGVTLPAQLRYSADLRAALADEAVRTRPLRVEAILQNRVDDLEALRTFLQGRYSGSLLDGYIGNIVTVQLPRGADAEAIAQEPGVLGVRLPRAAAETVFPAGAGATAPADVVKAARLDELHKLGYTGAGTKVLLIGSDFTGLEPSKRVRLVDLTTELATELQPLKPDPARAGTGTAAAKALLAAAPECELVLVRIDPGSFFHLQSVIRLARGDIVYTDAIQVRQGEVTARTRALDDERIRAVAAYKAAFADLSDNPVAAELRKKTRADLDAVFVKEKDLIALTNRLEAHQKNVRTLAGASVIVNTLVWESGYPIDAVNELASTIGRLADNATPRIVRPTAPVRPPLVWVQAASASGAAVWGGPFLDANRDGQMEFAPYPRYHLPSYVPDQLKEQFAAIAEIQLGMLPRADNWSQSLNFLGARPPGGETAPELAKGTKVRLVVQWREPADPNFPETDVPANALSLRLLRQIDPAGEKRSSDEMEEVARSASVPIVIYRTRTFLVFEQMLEVALAEQGRYALLVESVTGPEPLLPALRRTVEIYPRIAIETVGAGVADPRAVFRSYTAPTAGVGTPGDTIGAITVGTHAAGALVGGGTGLTLLNKPDLLGPAGLTFDSTPASGTGVATGFAGGTAALLVQTGAGLPNVFRSAGIESGAPLILPNRWLKIVPAAPRRRP